jgi:hypothetical protein
MLPIRGRAAPNFKATERNPIVCDSIGMADYFTRNQVAIHHEHLGQ